MKPLFKTALTLAIILSSTQLYAKTDSMPSAVDKNSCSKIDATKPFILVLSSGDDLLVSITQCAQDAKLTSASISGLGQVYNPTLAYFSSNPKDKPTLTTFSGYYELASLNGNITNNNGQYYTHAHVTLADQKFHGIAGHIDNAKIGLTAEITIVPFASVIMRYVDPDTGFGTIET